MPEIIYLPPSTPLDIECPHCGSPPGRVCVSASGKEVSSHAKRQIRAVVEENKPPPPPPVRWETVVDIDGLKRYMKVEATPEVAPPKSATTSKAPAPKLKVEKQWIITVLKPHGKNPNGRKPDDGSMSRFDRCEAYGPVGNTITVEDWLKLGGRQDDLKWDVRDGIISVEEG